MSYVYIDESGDTGRRSRYIIFASIETDNPKQLDKLVKKIWHAKPKLHIYGELHAYTADNSTRINVLNKLMTLNLQVRYMVVDKSTQRDSLPEVYNKILAKYISQTKDVQHFIYNKKE